MLRRCGSAARATCQLRLRLGIVRIDRAGLTNLREPFGDATTLGREDTALEDRRRPPAAAKPASEIEAVRDFQAHGAWPQHALEIRA